MASVIVESSSLFVTMTMARFGSASRSSRSASRPRLPGICSSSRTRLNGRRRTISTASSALVDRLDLEPFVPQEHAVWFEEFRLVVDPEDGLRRLRHPRNVAAPAGGNQAWVARGDPRSQVPHVPVTNPPYALATTTFRFAALAALAGRAPLGGQREVALATYLAARLAQDVLPERGVPQTSRAERAVGAKSWLRYAGAAGLGAPGSGKAGRRNRLPINEPPRLRFGRQPLPRRRFSTRARALSSISSCRHSRPRSVASACRTTR